MFGRKRMRWLLVLPLAFIIGGYLLLTVVNTGASRRTSLWPNGGAPTFVPPRGWQVYHLDSAGSSFTSPPAFLSNRSVSLGGPPGCMSSQPVQSCAPAVPSKLVDKNTGLADCTPHDTVTVCSPSYVPLTPGQGVVEWVQVDALPGSGDRPAPGALLTVDGHEARMIIREHRPLLCPPGSSESIVGRVYYQVPGTVPRPRYSSWYEMDACLRGPGLVRLQAQVLAIFRSLQGVS